MNKSVVVGMSGGVDSSVTAAILKDMGFSVTGVTFALRGKCGCPEVDESCCNAAADVARIAGFPHRVVHNDDVFFEKVAKPFAQAYVDGETPNPCMSCNRYIKFPGLFAVADEIGADYVATGHYAVTERDSASGRVLLKKAKDLKKDQTYFLYSLTQEMLARIIFPLESYLKTETRQIAEEKGFPNAKAKESQDICFIRGENYTDFIRRVLNKDFPNGDFVDTNGKVIGKHNGIINYTVGQRRGLGISSANPLYVVAKDAQKNTVTLGEEKTLYTKSLTAGNVNLIAVPQINGTMRVMVKTRHSQSEQPALVTQTDETHVNVEFLSPQRAITPGQSVVFYDGEYVVGGGIIRS